jgi:hypothetical protein
LDQRGNVVGVVSSQLDAVKVVIASGDLPQNINFAIKGSLAHDFLAAHNVFPTRTTTDRQLSTPDVVEIAKKISVALVCHPAVNVETAPKTASPASTQIPTTEQLVTRSKQFLIGMYQTLSNREGELLGFWERTYAETLEYYGKKRPRDEVIAELKKFVARWPSRQYKPKESSLEIQCNAEQLICHVKGVLEFDARSVERQERSFGTANFDYELRYGSASLKPAIVMENGFVIERHKSAWVSDGKG